MSDQRMLEEHQREIAQNVQLEGGAVVATNQTEESPEIEPAPPPRLIDLVNPHGLKVGHVKEVDPKFAGGKYYLPKLRFGPTLLIGREQYKRASEADTAAQAWKDELIAEYELKIANAIAEAQAGESQQVAP